MTQITDRIAAMPMPQGAERVYYDGVNSIGFYLNGGLRFIHFPPGTWRFLFTTKSATEEDARKVVEHDDFIGGYKDYDTDRFHHEDPFIKATDSLDSLLHSKGLDTDKNYALIEKL